MAIEKLTEEEVKEALHEVEMAHCAIWTAFDPGADAGPDLQPKKVKDALKLLREYMAEHGKVMEGFYHGE